MKRILVLEDNNAVLNYIGEVVTELDFKVEVCLFADIRDAYQCALERQIDCFIVDIILDTKVPGDLSGFKFIENIQKIQKYILTPIIIISSLEDAKLFAYDKFHCFKFLEKPFSKVELLSLLEVVLKGGTEPSPKTMIFSVSGILMTADINDILYVELAQRILQIHTKENGILSVPYKTIKEFLAEADCDDLIRCSRYCVVNRKHVKNYDKANRMIHLKSKSDILNVGKTFQKQVEEGLRGK